MIWDISDDERLSGQLTWVRSEQQRLATQDGFALDERWLQQLAEHEAVLLELLRGADLTERQSD